MTMILYSYFIAAAYSIIAREFFGMSAHNPWNWGVAAGIVGLGIASLWFDNDNDNV